MIRKVGLTVILFAGCIWCLALATQANSAQDVPTRMPFKPVASVKSLMHGQGAFFKTIMTELEKPAGAERNQEIRESAEVLAELANVNRHHAQKDDYLGWSTQVRDVALQLAAEAGKKGRVDDARLNTILGTMKSACGACHDVYQE